MDTFELIDILIKNSTFSRGKLVSLMKQYPLEKFATKILLEEILDEKDGKTFTNPEDFVSFLFNESKNRKLTAAQSRKKSKLLVLKEEELKRKKDLRAAKSLQKTYAFINSQQSCNSCGALVNMNGMCKCQ
jgi:hypothetical protein